MMQRALVALVLSLAACGPSPSPSVTSVSPKPTTALVASPFTFTFDVQNRSRVPVVVSVASDTAATMPGFEPGQRGTISIPLLNPQNGVGVEVQGVHGAQCRVLAKGEFPTPVPFTLLVEDAPGSGNVRLTLVAGASSTPLPLPSNSLFGCGG